MKLWHAWAIKMRANGSTHEEIAARFNKSMGTIAWLLCPNGKAKTYARIRKQRGHITGADLPKQPRTAAWIDAP